MKPVEILSSEHRVIEIVLECLEKMSQQYQRNGSFNIDHANDAVDFIRNFADRCHHGKEEDNLFPALVKKGMPIDGGPIGVMLFEHTKGREYVAAMAQALSEVPQLGDKAKNRFFQSASQYVELLRSHIHKEDHILFPMANQIMSDQDHAAMLQLFDKVEHEHIGAGVHEKYLKLAQSLATAYGVDPSAMARSTSGGSFGCHH